MAFPRIFMFPFYTSSLEKKTLLFTRQSKVQIEKVLQVDYLEKLPTVTGSKHLSILFFLKGGIFCYLLTENGRHFSVGFECQCAASSDENYADSLYWTFLNWRI